MFLGLAERERGWKWFNRPWDKNNKSNNNNDNNNNNNNINNEPSEIYLTEFDKKMIKNFLS